MTQNNIFQLERYNQVVEATANLSHIPLGAISFGDDRELDRSGIGLSQLEQLACDSNVSLSDRPAHVRNIWNESPLDARLQRMSRRDAGLLTVDVLATAGQDETTVRYLGATVLGLLDGGACKTTLGAQRAVVGRLRRIGDESRGYSYGGRMHDLADRTEEHWGHATVRRIAIGLGAVLGTHVVRTRLTR